MSIEGIPYDIKKLGDKDKNIRYIDVKSRAQSGDIALTQNEWFKAQRFKEDYYLYVVYDASKSPQLFIIQNPAERLRAQEKVEIVRFIIDGEDVIKTGEVVRH